MKTTIIALSAAALIATAPAVFAQGVSSKVPSPHHKVSGKLHPRVSGYAHWRAMQAYGLNRSYPRPFGYAPSQPKDYTLENSRQAGGGGGGGRGGGGGGGGGGM